MIPGALALAVAAVWATSLSGAFVLDDLLHIVDNPALDRLWPPDWTRHGATGSFRPVLMFTFALNVAAGGRSPAGFHFVNLLIHLAATLVLYDLLRRTLDRPGLRAACRLDPAHAAGAVALLWALHPLQTESVTYLCQRGESFMGLLHLLVLNLGLRAHAEPGRTRWRVGAWVACGLGMGVKESMIITPIAVVLYDRCFLYPSLRAAGRERGALWAGLAAGWIPFLVLMPAFELYTRGRPTAAAAAGYALTQPGVLLHYLRLAVWPVGLVLEENWPTAPGLRAALPAIAGLALMTTSAWYAGRRRPGLGAAGLWALLCLAPTSTVIPLRDPAVEHRMYLPLAAVMLFVVVLGRALLHRVAAGLRLPERWTGRIGAGWVLGFAALLGGLTIHRNTLYRSPIALYADVVLHRPESVRGHQNLAWALATDGRFDDAIAHTRRTLELDPGYAEGWFNLGVYLTRAGHETDALTAYRRALALDPGNYRAAANLHGLLRRRDLRERVVP